ncbi:uncharacterized protein LOC125505323 isoform X2 [Dendroctonus ponderosae]|uniref:uncharacterized protein LOC125505323 isoform X2 n=1 Tax=Dendroctonus ponderosae TaxID=77166 RepID=UPI00203584C7|nr:uncharacterized protein LOC125505323 isoform X2 [Dendroctonus ponderosae]
MALYLGYEGDEESGASSCSLQQYASPHRTVGINLDRERCGLPWTTNNSERFIICSVPQNDYKFIADLKIRKSPNNRMVLEPKFVDYGSIHPTPDGHTHQVHHGVSGPRSALLSPLDDEDVTANASAGPKMTQGEFKSLLEFVFA